MTPAHFLAQIRRRLRLVVALRAVAVLTVANIAIAAVLVLVDRVWWLPGWVRTVNLALLLAGAGTFLWLRWWRTWRQRLDDGDLARLVERRRGELDGRLVSAVAGVPLGDEAERLQGQLAAILPRAVIEAPRLERWLVAAGAALVVVATSAALTPTLLRDGAQRLMLPWSGHAWTRLTTLSVRLERPVVAEDEPLVLRIARQHPNPAFAAPVLVSWRHHADGAQERSESRRLPSLSGSTFSQAITATAGEVTVAVSSGDAVAATVTGRVVARPVLARATADFLPPAYAATAGAAATEHGAALAGDHLAGTRVRFALGFELEPGRTLATCRAEWRSGHDVVEIPLDLRDGTATGELMLRTAGDLVVGASDADGIAVAGDPRFRLGVTDDRAPVVTIDGPQPRELVGAGAVISVRVQANDDLGLAALSLTASAVAGERTLFDRQDLTAANAQETLAVEIASLGKAGEGVTLQAVARDRNDITGPGIGRSEPLPLRIVADDQLRQDLDRQLADARERLARAREETASALANPERRAGLARSAAQTAATADGLLVRVERRWRDNRLPADPLPTIAKARGSLTETALPRLADAGDGEADPLRQADAALAEAERLVASLLSESDLARQLASLVARQQALADESRAFVRAYLTKPIDQPGRTQQTNLANRQRELADQVAELERRILSREGSAWAKGQELVKQAQPGERLRSAATDLASGNQRPNAVEAQQLALAALKALLEEVRGSDQAADLAARLAEAEREQRALVREAMAGAPTAELARDQQALAERTERLAREAQADPEVKKLLQAAKDAQQRAQQAMEKGDRAGAERDGTAAAGLLAAARAKADPGKEESPKDDQQGLGKLLAQLRRDQAALVSAVAELHRLTGDAVLPFDAARIAGTLATTQAALRSKLHQEAIEPLARNPVATVALGRVENAMLASGRHLRTPAVGSRGVRLATIALAELERLISVTANAGRTAEGQAQGGGGGGGGGGQQKPGFEPHAEVALLADLQEELGRLTDANRPADLAAQQRALAELAESLGAMADAGSRPQELLVRSQQAMTHAGDRLAKLDRGAATRTEQDAAVAALRRLLAELPKPSGGGSSGQPPPPGGKPGDGQGGGESDGGASGTSGGQGGESAAGRPVQGGSDSGDLLRLPPEVRERLRQAREQDFSPAQLSIYRRYLELLEEQK